MLNTSFFAYTCYKFGEILPNLNAWQLAARAMTNYPDVV